MTRSFEISSALEMQAISRCENMVNFTILMHNSPFCKILCEMAIDLKKGHPAIENIDIFKLK